MASAEPGKAGEDTGVVVAAAKRLRDRLVIFQKELVRAAQLVNDHGSGQRMRFDDGSVGLFNHGGSITNAAREAENRE